MAKPVKLSASKCWYWQLVKSDMIELYQVCRSISYSNRWTRKAKKACFLDSQESVRTPYSTPETRKSIIKIQKIKKKNWAEYTDKTYKKKLCKMKMKCILTFAGKEIDGENIV